MKKGRDLKFGLIGCGSLGGSVRLPNLRRLPGLEVTAVADPDAALRDRALRTARQARVYPSGKAWRNAERVRPSEMVKTRAATMGWCPGDEF